MIRWILQYRKETTALLLIFFVALGLRLIYQQESIVNNALRADASKYFSAAYNLHKFNVFSLDLPRADLAPPTSRSDLSPLYPILLSFYMDDDVLEHLDEFVARVLRVQAVLGALVAALTFLTARLYLGFGWAFLAGALTAISPHLIALDGYFLTESLFTFFLMLGIYILSLAWRFDRVALTLIGGLLLAASAEIRAVSILLVFSLAPLFLFVRGRPLLSIRARWIRHLAAIALSFFVVMLAHREFVQFTVTHEPGVLAVVTGKENLHTVRELPQKYVVFQSPWAYLKRNVRPPKFFVDGNSHIVSINRDRSWKNSTEAEFADAPIAYIEWNLVGKIVVLWHFDNAYNGDVYIYPMIRRGFVENELLQQIHAFMRAAHWPLFWLSLAAPLALFVLWRRGALPTQVLPILIPVLGFIYFLAVLWVLTWLPRYTIPVRPMSYILAAYTLSLITAAITSAKTPAVIEPRAKSRKPKARVRNQQKRKKKRR